MVVGFFPSFGQGAFAFAPTLLWWLYRRGKAFDVVHVHGLFNPISSLAARLVLRRGRALVLRPFGTLSRYTFQHRRAALKRLYFRCIDRPSVMRADALHFTTTAERDEAARLDLDLDGRSHVAPPPFRGRVQRTKGSRASRPTALFLSRLHPKKNVGGLLEAWPEVRSAVPDARLVIAGDGEAAYVKALKDQAARSGLEESVSFVGFVRGEEKARHLSEAHVFVLPSHQENFGVAVLEALAADLPVIISPEVQLAPFVEAHRLGRVTARRPEPLAEALTDALQNERLQTRCAERAPQLVEEHFSTDAVGEQLRAMYAAVRKGRG